jgi:hypothetical protein
MILEFTLGISNANPPSSLDQLVISSEFQNPLCVIDHRHPKADILPSFMAQSVGEGFVKVVSGSGGFDEKACIEIERQSGDNADTRLPAVSSVDRQESYWGNGLDITAFEFFRTLLELRQSTSKSWSIDVYSIF